MREDIVTRNFFRILRAAAFQEKEELEPMSHYKWNKLSQLMDNQGMKNYFETETGKNAADERLNIPRYIIERSANTLLTADEDTEADIPPLSNRFLNKRLRKIIETEHSDEEASPETLEILGLIILNLRQMLNHGIDTGSLIRIGTLLRKKGHKVDYVKLEKWLAKLHLKRMAQFEGSVLISVFGFSPEEIPFVMRQEKEAHRTIIKTVWNDHGRDRADEWHFRQRTDGYAASHSRPLRRNLRLSLKCFKYASIEATSSLLDNLVRRLWEIEE